MNDPLSRKTRLRALEGLLLSQGESDREFDRLTRLGSQLLEAPVCLISLVTPDRQIFKGACGLPPELAATRETPISHSICKFVVLDRQPYVVRHATADPRVADHPAVLDIGVEAYLGFPLMTDEGDVLGSFCVIDFVPREWSSGQLDLTRNLAALALGQLEAAIMRERSRNALDVVIHDLKSPMSSVIMASCLLNEARAQVPEKLHPLLEVITEASGKAIRLIESLADDDQTASTSPESDPARVLGSVVSRLAARAEAKNIQLHLEIDEAQPLLIPGWVLEQVLENLVGNAIKFSPPGSSVRIIFTPDGNAGLIDVSDAGPGFTEEDRKRLFKRYTRLSALPTGGETSTGLGLSIVKRLLVQHGGAIDLLSAPGAGAHFRVTVPMT